MRQRPVFYILCFALALSLFGFFIDGDVREPSIWTNIFEVSMMSIVIFGMLLVPYGLFVLVGNLLRKNSLAD